MKENKKNKYSKLEIVDYTNLDEFMMCFTKSADTIINSEEKDCISLYASADTISSALQILLNDYDYNISNIGYIDLARFYYNDKYDAEYCLRITDEGHICIEKARNGDTFEPYNIYNEVACFYQEECEQDLIDKGIEGAGNMAILFGFEEDEDCCDDEDNSLDTNESESTHVSRDKNGRVLGFSKSWSTLENGVNRYSSYSHYSDNFDDLKKLARDFGVEL